MLSESAPDVKFEIGHVLFIDIVGYSKLLITEQSEKLQKLGQIVRGTEQFRLADAEGKLLRLPTGDGGALVFRTSPEAPVLCALEISKALKVILNFESEWVFTAGLSEKSINSAMRGCPGNSRPCRNAGRNCAGRLWPLRCW